MSRSHHVTSKQLRRERAENALCGCDGAQVTELEEKDLKKRIAKTNTDWKRQAKRDGMPPRARLRLKKNLVERV